MLNIIPSFQHHWEAYGFWAPAVGDYVEMNLMDWMGHPAYPSLMDIVEPYSYRERYTMPKLIMNSTGDQFFVLDSSQFYFDDLPGTKFLRYVPTTDPGLGGSDAVESLIQVLPAVQLRQMQPPIDPPRIRPAHEPHVTQARRPVAMAHELARPAGGADGDHQ